MRQEFRCFVVVLTFSFLANAARAQQASEGKSDAKAATSRPAPADASAKTAAPARPADARPIAPVDPTRYAGGFSL